VNLLSIKQIFISIGLCLILLMLAGCEKTLEVDPQLIAISFYANLKDKDFEKASELFSPGMQESASHQAWIDFMAGVQEDLGKLNKVRFKNIETNTVRTGRMFIFDVAASYEKGNAAETLRLFQHLSATDLEAVSYDVRANGLTVRAPR